VRTRAAVVATVAGALALGAVALQAGATGPGEEAGIRRVEIVMRYSRFDPGRVEVHPGETVRFVLRNEDPIDHEFIVGDARVQLAHERGTEAHHPPRPGEISVPPGTTRVTTVSFPERPDQILFGCHLPGHYRYGMVGTIEQG
jgi:uncharacterized cupredoxin-like copper-binding protein